MNACGLDRQPGHAGLVAEDAATRARARWIDGQDRDPLPLPEQIEAEGLDEGALPGARNTGDPDPRGYPGMRQQDIEEILGLGLMIRPGTLDERDRFGERAAAPGTHLARQGLHRRHRVRFLHGCPGPLHRCPPPGAAAPTANRSSIGAMVVMVLQTRSRALWMAVSESPAGVQERQQRQAQPQDDAARDTQPVRHAARSRRTDARYAARVSATITIAGT